MMITIERSFESAMFQGPEPSKRSKGGVEHLWVKLKNLAAEEFCMQINPDLLTLQDPCKLVEEDERHGKAPMAHWTFAHSERSCHPKDNGATVLNEALQGSVVRAQLGVHDLDCVVPRPGQQMLLLRQHVP